METCRAANTEDSEPFFPVVSMFVAHTVDGRNYAMDGSKKHCKLVELKLLCLVVAGGFLKYQQHAV